MKLFINAFLLLASLSVANSYSQETLRGNFSVMTYNVAGLPYWINDMDAYRFPALGQKLNDYDLVMLQEDFWYHDEITKTAKFPYKSTPKELSWHDTWNGKLVNDGLNRFSRFPIKDFTRKAWGDCYRFGSDDKGGGGDCLATKGFSVARHKIRSTGGIEFEIDIYNMHMESGSSTEAKDLRIKQTFMMFEYMKTFSLLNPVIVVGDFNHSQGNMSDLYNSFLQDARLTDSFQTLGLGKQNKWKIDRIFYRNSNGIKLDPVRYDSPDFRDKDNKPLSDHRPVIVWFDWLEITPDPEPTVEPEISEPVIEPEKPEATIEPVAEPESPAPEATEPTVDPETILEPERTPETEQTSDPVEDISEQGQEETTPSIEPEESQPVQPEETDEQEIIEPGNTF
ncbi:hypothetical protein EOPP23_04540 [Endozoicomonas sp. OPT23]|uniref:endonuclease/exonuclease/phosphatase family protein n=1 Tax=Endozoicomonas sp. OPT23 TaxID=2072845 RepID=UPI00129B343A|nr:endonuclease/exonuclease/phosphatase family protein [Endozoicomonas sp. OPT23]MRI32261.1 hypothetical protein [Endozoicomonas sp. OPT23]